jgi:hypothetical protein
VLLIRHIGGLVDRSQALSGDSQREQKTRVVVVFRYPLGIQSYVVFVYASIKCAWDSEI